MKAALFVLATGLAFALGRMSVEPPPANTCEEIALPLHQKLDALAMQLDRAPAPPPPGVQTPVIPAPPPVVAVTVAAPPSPESVAAARDADALLGSARQWTANEGRQARHLMMQMNMDQRQAFNAKLVEMANRGDIVPDGPLF